MNQLEIRKEYPFFTKNKEVYFDNNASSLKPSSVIGAENYYNAFVSTNSGRGVYKLAYSSTKLIEQTRNKVAEFLNASENEIVFTRNTTESLNLAVLSYVLPNLKKGDEIVVSVIDHHSLYLPLLEVAKKTGAILKHIPLDSFHKVTAENLKSVLSSKTKIVALTYVSNVTGAKIDAKKMINLAHEKGAKVILDAAQAVPHFKTDVKDLDCDFLAFSGYKIGAPTGVGVLYGKYELLQKMPPIYFGGGMVNDSLSKPVEYKDAPYKFEAGTLAIGQIAGLKNAIEFLEKVGFSYIQKKDRKLYNYFMEQLSEIKEVEIYNKDADIATVLFNLKGLHSHDSATAYDMYDICVRAGHHCAQPFINYLGQVSTLRASLYFYNTKAEIDKFIEATKKIIQYFKQF